MKFEPNWKDKSLENLEKQIWPASDGSEDSYLIRTCLALRKKRLKDFEVEDLRIMIGQNIGLKYLVPLAIEELKKNILAAGDFYEGDLLKHILVSDPKYWESEKEYWRTVCQLMEVNKARIAEFDTTPHIKRSLFDAYADFKKINE